MFLETLCIENNVVKNQEAHWQRIQKTAAHFGFRPPKTPDILRKMPTNLASTKTKCSIIYKEEINKITFTPYIPKRVNSLKLVEAPHICYRFKYADRDMLNQLRSLKSEYSEVLITQNGCITDTTYSNVACKRGDTYFTPDTYLLNGTKRQWLIQQGILHEVRITKENLHSYDAVILINAMLDLEDGIVIPTKNIY